ncbi:hypothetical protein IJ531_05150, partial [bacterium]|nr:hypothetical protein [bacterium]
KTKMPVQNKKNNNIALSFTSRDSFTKARYVPLDYAKGLIDNKYQSNIQSLKEAATAQWNTTMELFNNTAAETDVTNMVIKYNSLRSALKDTPQGLNLNELLKDFSWFAFREFCTLNEEDPWENSIFLITKDKEFGEELLSLLVFDGRVRGYTEYITQKKHIAETPFRVIFETLRKVDSDNPNDTFRVLSPKIRENAKRYDETGLKTVLMFDGIEMLGSPKTCLPPGIAILKDLMQKMDRAYRTQIHTVVEDYGGFDPGITTSNRIIYSKNIDELNLTRNDLEPLQQERSRIEPILDRPTSIFQEGYAKYTKLKKEHEAANVSYLEKVKQLDTLYDNPAQNYPAIIKFLKEEGFTETEILSGVPNEIIEASEKVIKSNSKTPIAIIAAITAASVALITGGIILNSKAKKQKAQLNEAKAQ